MVRKQKNTRALIKKRNKQDEGGEVFGRFFRLMTGTKSNAVAPTPGEAPDLELKKIINRENVKINEKRLVFNKEEKGGASLTSGGNDFIALLNHCNLYLKKEKKPVKKAAEKQQKSSRKAAEKQQKSSRKAAEKQPVKKAAEKQPVKKPTKKPAEKKPTMKQ